MAHRISSKEKSPTAYSKPEIISEVQTTMAMEYMMLDNDEIAQLEQYQNASAQERDEIRSSLLRQLSEG